MPVLFLEFQSTPSVGRATVQYGLARDAEYEFQSTPSVGRATIIHLVSLAIGLNFNPRPPWGGRRPRQQDTHHTKRISIHALRGEGDFCCFINAGERRDFNPRPPWGGRLIRIFGTHRSNKFQSTPSVGRATNSRKFQILSIRISIHALRGEGDS